MENKSEFLTENFSSPSIVMPIYFYKNFDIKQDKAYLFGMSNLSKFIQNINHYIYLLSKRLEIDDIEVTYPVDEFSDTVSRGMFIIENGKLDKPFSVIRSEDFTSLLNKSSDSVLNINDYKMSVILVFKKSSPHLTRFYFKFTKKGNGFIDVFLTVPKHLNQISVFQ